MASIAVSLGGGGRRNAGSSSTGSTLQHNTNGLRSSPGSTSDTLRSAKQTPQNGNNNQIRSEMDLLRKIIQDKDAIIQT